MVDQIEAVTFDTPTTATTLDITHPRITQPFTAAILIFTREQTDGADNSHAVLGYGFIAPDGTTEPDSAISIQISNASRTAPLANTLHSGAAAAKCIQAAAGDTATVAIAADYSASIAGGVRLSFTTVDLTGGPAGGPVRSKCTAILFAGLSRGFVNSCTASLGGTHEAVGDAGTGLFQPDLVIFAPSEGATNASHTDGYVTLGFAVRSPAAQIVSLLSFDSVTEPTDADGDARSNRGYEHFIARALENATIAIDATGFTATSSVSSPDSNYLALKFSGNVRIAVAQMAVAAATGVQSFNSFGFTPDLLFGMISPLTSTDTLTDGPTASAGGYLACTKDYQRAYCIHAEEGKTNGAAASFNVHTRQEDVALLLYNHTGSVVQRATFEGASGSGGFNLNFSVASQAGMLTALGIQIVPNPPLPQRRARRHRRARFTRRMRRFIVGGRPVGQPPLVRMLKAVLRARRRARARLWWRPKLTPTAVPLVGDEVEFSTARVTGAGLLHGRISGPGVPSPEVDE